MCSWRRPTQTQQAQIGTKPARDLKGKLNSDLCGCLLLSVDAPDFSPTASCQQMAGSSSISSQPRSWRGPCSPGLFASMVALGGRISTCLGPFATLVSELVTLRPCLDVLRLEFLVPSAMVFFGQPPDPAAAKNFFPGISAKSFSPASAAVCYRECIQKENNARNDAHESEKIRHAAKGVCLFQCGCADSRSLLPSSVCSGTRDQAAKPANEIHGAQTWRDASWPGKHQHSLQ